MSTNNRLMKPLSALAAPGIYLFCKFNQFKRQQIEQSRQKATEKELHNLNNKISKLLNKLEEHENEKETSQSGEDDCVVCLGAKATVKTFPCHHQVLCRMCFVKTIQSAISQRCLPLCCVICRAKILKLENLSKEDLYKEPRAKHGSHNCSSAAAKSNKKHRNSAHIMSKHFTTKSGGATVAIQTVSCGID